MRELFVPALGMAMEECLLVEWLKQPGDEVESGDEVAVIETDKATMELEAPASGRLGPHLYPAGSTVPVGEIVTHILEDDEDASSLPDPPDSSERPRDSSERPTPTAGADPATASVGHDAGESPGSDADPSEAEVPASPGSEGARSPHSLSPRQRRLAAEQRQESARGTADRHRAAVAQAVTESWRTIPHFGVTSHIRADVLVATLRRVRQDAEHITATDLLLRAFALALAEKGRGGGSLGLAVATERGVAIPVISQVASMPLEEVADARREAVQRARNSRMSAEDGAVPEFSLSNLGIHDVEYFTGIIPIGQQGLLTVGRAKERPVVADGVLAAMTTVYATLNVDHRLLDGMHVAAILDGFGGILNDPARLMGR